MNCPKCKTEVMTDGIAIVPSVVSSGDAFGATLSYGPGYVSPVLKCHKCGYSVVGLEIKHDHIPTARSSV